ncbi:MAG: VOC family protein [Chloroflexaceae bacterium]|nr:VOC family protein [Chloroflexaceae bacterium]
MIAGIDHVVILVNDLAQASTHYKALGFTVVPGGTHADGATHNALIIFQDSSYLELLQFLREAPEHRWWRHVVHGEGLIDWALLPTTIADDVQAAQQAGLHLDGPLPGGRLRPDGKQVEWQMAFPPSPDLPFLCGDVTPRTLRVPEGDHRTHPNGVLGIAGVVVAVNHIDTSVTHYRALLQVADETRTGNTGATELPQPIIPELGARIALLPAGNAAIMLAQPGGALLFRALTDDEETTISMPSTGPLTTALAERGEGLYSLALRVSTGRDTGYDTLLHNPTNTHGVRVELIAE